MLALVWLVSQASFAEREVDGLPLRLGETPPVSLTRLEVQFRWTRKAARIFLEYILSARCAEETGIRVRLGQKVQGHSKGHTEGHSQGHTYIIGLVKDTQAPGHTEGHSQGHTLGHSEKKEEGKKTDNPPIVPPTGGAKRRRSTGWREMPAEWQPADADTEYASSLGMDPEWYDWELGKIREHEFQRPHSDPSKTWRAWIRTATERGRPRNLNGNASHAAEVFEADGRAEHQRQQDRQREEAREAYKRDVAEWEARMTKRWDETESERRKGFKTQASAGLDNLRAQNEERWKRTVRWRCLQLLGDALGSPAPVPPANT